MYCMKNLFISLVCLFAIMGYMNAFSQNHDNTKAISVATNLEDMYNWNLYPTYQTYLDFMNYYADTYPNICKLDTIGYTTQNRLLLALKISSNPNIDQNKPKFFYSSSIHGNELTGTMVLMQFIDTLITSTADDIIQLRNSIQMYICPMANPDGTYIAGDNSVSSAVRYNANYLDLNRNFPDPKAGAHPDGESYQVETLAFMEYALRERFHISSNLHTGSEVYNYPFDCYRSSQKEHADKSWFEGMGNEFVGAFSSSTPSNYFTDVSSNGIIDGGDWYTVFGGRQDWHTYFAHCREITLELSMDYTPSNAKIKRYWEYLHNSMFVMPKYCLIGFEGVVKDTLTDEVLDNVMIKINNHDRDSSEVFSNSNGYFFRPILSGNYSVTFSKDGYYSKTINVNTSNDMTTLQDVKLLSMTQSIEKNPKKDVKIYPMPVNSVMVVEVGEDMNYSIFDMQGQMIMNGRIHSRANVLDVSKLDNGNYFFKIYNAKEQYNKKILVIK